METFQETARVVTSKPVQRAFVNTVLLVSGAVILFCLAAIASALFFQNFVPDQFVTTPVHLQYGSSANPYGVAALSVPLLKSQQDYDISVTLSMPRSPANIERGNFMVALYLLGSKIGTVSAHQFANSHADFGQHAVLFASRRPALVPYVDPVVSLASHIMFLFYHLLVPGTQTCTMIIPLAESVVFPRDSAIPASAYVEVEAGQEIQIYSAALTMTAQLSGLRWLMFYYRLPTYLAFTFLFWVCELLFMSAAWTVLSYILGASPTSKYEPRKQGQKGRSAVKDELDDSDFDGDQNDPSDYPQTFPTYGKQPPLKHEPEVKKEKEEEREQRVLSEIPMGGTEADDEAEGEGEGEGEGNGNGHKDLSQRDSGMGTSYSEEGSDGVRRRASRSAME